MPSANCHWHMYFVLASTAAAASMVELGCRFPEMTYYQFWISKKNPNPMGENCYGRLPDTSTVHCAAFIGEITSN